MAYNFAGVGGNVHALGSIVGDASRCLSSNGNFRSDPRGSSSTLEIYLDGVVRGVEGTR